MSARVAVVLSLWLMRWEETSSRRLRMAWLTSWHCSVSAAGQTDTKYSATKGADPLSNDHCNSG